MILFCNVVANRRNRTMVYCGLFVYHLQHSINVAGKSMTAAQSLLKGRKHCTFFHFNTFYIYICLTHTRIILIARFSTALSIFQIALSDFSIFVLLKRNKTFCSTGICYDEPCIYLSFVSARQSLWTEI